MPQPTFKEWRESHLSSEKRVFLKQEIEKILLNNGIAKEDYEKCERHVIKTLFSNDDNDDNLKLAVVMGFVVGYNRHREDCANSFPFKSCAL